MSTYQAAKTLRQRWFIKEAYPLYAVIGAGCVAATFMLTRTLFNNPDSRVFKKYRMEEMPVEERELKRGESFYNHAIRKAVHGANIGIFPNKWFTKPEETDD